MDIPSEISAAIDDVLTASWQSEYRDFKEFYTEQTGLSTDDWNNAPSYKDIPDEARDHAFCALLIIDEWMHEHSLYGVAAE